MNLRLIAVLLLLTEAMNCAQSSAAFTPTGKMTTLRNGHTATLLPNGKVLIAGGSAPGGNGDLAVATAELYDPSTGVFAAVSSMSVPRAWHNATLLPNGLVLIAGGVSRFPGSNGQPPSGVEASTEIFDSSNGTFTASGNLNGARASAIAILLNDGRVLIAGGVDRRQPSANFLVSSELFDPVTGTFSSSGDALEGGLSGPAVLMADGKVLFPRGYGQISDSPLSAEIYDPATETFSLTGASAYPDTYTGSLNLLTNGKVLETVHFSCDADNEAELFDPFIGTFSPTGKMTASRDAGNGTLLPDGTVLITGGSGAGDALDSGAIRAELYNPATGTFSLAGSMTEDRFLPTATLLNDGSVLIAGGIGWKPGFQCCVTLASAEIYHPAVLRPSPVLLSVPGNGQGAILHTSTQQLVSPDNPAVAGEALEIFGTGLIDGSVIPPQVAIGGLMAEVLFFGKAPGYAGLNQINVRVPSGVATGPSVSVRLNYIGRPSNEVTISVQVGGL